MLLRSRPKAYGDPHGGPNTKCQGENQGFSKEKLNGEKRRKHNQLRTGTIARNTSGGASLTTPGCKSRTRKLGHREKRHKRAAEKKPTIAQSPSPLQGPSLKQPNCGRGEIFSLLNFKVVYHWTGHFNN